MIKFVKKQQKAVLEGLIHESLALERELEDYKANALTGSSEEEHGLFHEVPAELLSLECPYPDLKSLVIQEYQELASGYWERLQEVDQQLETLSRNSDWKEEDQWVFQAVISQYPSDLQRRRTLYLDVLQRYLPHKCRQELVAQEKAWDRCHSIRNQRRVVLLTWAQARRAFVLRAVAAAAEAAAAHEAEVALADSRHRQLEICAELKAKVLQWKAQQEEAAKLEAAVAARRKEKEDERERLQREQETIRRAQEKEKVAVVAQSDPARAVADTVASRARMGTGASTESELQQPLFRLHTYTEEQIISDPRLRVELALREAGLHKTLYAREILPKIPPPKLPRRDMESTAFKV
ncbi:coiled-coil domain-containing protein 148 isoform X3 [Willisornis vidua]|uniref:Coiled-coil domain-containing protein 148 isoform X3 n=1 Tax=Willisornis vidua TaxID=1566151 RepID=A0ABQ9DJW5_9PASS|nr:coiled-coil domain-containing protein 148 isoform X3 [Willisornis vidua]